MQLDPRLSEISLDGFQVVSGQMFAHLPRKSDATCTLWPTSISFSKQAVVLLNNCEHIRIEINPTTKGLLVVPVTSKDQDSVGLRVSSRLRPEKSNARLLLHSFTILGDGTRASCTGPLAGCSPLTIRC